MKCNKKVHSIIVTIKPISLRGEKRKGGRKKIIQIPYRECSSSGLESQIYIKKLHSSPGLLKPQIEAVHFWGYNNQLHVITLKNEIYSINNIKLPSHSSYENTRKEENYFLPTKNQLYTPNISKKCNDISKGNFSMFHHFWTENINVTPIFTAIFQHFYYPQRNSWLNDNFTGPLCGPGGFIRSHVLSQYNFFS